jgi:hypothetical protein
MRADRVQHDRLRPERKDGEVREPCNLDLSIMSLQRTIGNAATTRLLEGRIGGVIQRVQLLDDVLRRGRLEYDTCPATIFLSAELSSFAQNLEAEAHAENLEAEAHAENLETGGQTEKGAALGYTEHGGPLIAVSGGSGQNGSFDPGSVDQRQLGFKYQGTIHTHPRNEIPHSFSAMDLITVMTGKFNERVSVMVSGDFAHVLVRCDDSVNADLQKLLEQIVTTSLEEKYADIDEEVELTLDQVIEVGKQQQTLSAIGQAARSRRIAYYFGKIGGELMRM